VALPRALRRSLAVVLVVGIAVSLYVATFLLWSTASDRADAACASMLDGDGTYSVSPTWQGGVVWDCEYATAWNPRGTVVLTPEDLLSLK